jgi:predicted RNA-binding Zn-ribbon protein involved in translation (DUF1610 family)
LNDGLDGAGHECAIMTTRQDKWMVAASAGLLLGSGLVAMMLGPSLDEVQRSAALTIGGVLVAGAVLLAGITLWGAARRRTAYRRAARYACPRCGLAPPPPEVPDAASVPCPRCGQLIEPPDTVAPMRRTARPKS